MTKEPFVSAACRGEVCSICKQPATRKVEEAILADDPNPYRHSLVAYVCEAHFNKIMGITERETAPI